jgi:hypothetical protein
MIIFGIASGWVIYHDQLEAFGAIRNHPTSPSVVRKETDELIFDLTSAYAAALAVAVLVGALVYGGSPVKPFNPCRRLPPRPNKSTQMR